MLLRLQKAKGEDKSSLQNRTTAIPDAREGAILCVPTKQNKMTYPAFDGGIYAVHANAGFLNKRADSWYQRRDIKSKP